MTTAIVEKTFYAWLICPLSEKGKVDDIVPALIKLGFNVGPLGRNLILAYTDKPSIVIALTLYRNPTNDAEKTTYTSTGVYDEVLNICKLKKVKVQAMIVSEASPCAWNVGNISVAEEEEEELRRRGLVN